MMMKKWLLWWWGCILHDRQYLQRSHPAQFHNRPSISYNGITQLHCYLTIHCIQYIHLCDTLKNYVWIKSHCTVKRTSEELRMLSRSLSDCQSLNLNHWGSMSWFEFLDLSRIVNCVTRSLKITKSLSISLSLSLFMSFSLSLSSCWSCHISSSFWSIVRKDQERLCSGLKTLKSKRQLTDWQ